MDLPIASYSTRVFKNIVEHKNPRIALKLKILQRIMTSGTNFD